MRNLLVIWLVVETCLGQDRVVLHNCDPNVPNTCGPPPGRCLTLITGNRCRCGHGRMGIRCQRPCQDVYRSCGRWKEEGRCEWGRFILPFFEDNCAKSCSVCGNDGTVLAKALPVGLEPLAWLVGRWETKVSNNLRFPTPMVASQGYHEILEVQLNEVNMFDRPTLNISVRARSGIEEHNELGFVTMKPAKEDTGFQKTRQERQQQRDQVAIEMTSNTGVATIEEGILVPFQLVLHVTHKVTLDLSDPGFVTAVKY
uniref:EGF-like domain-containing protein n=1 Tax=Bursaphelenchus xylophilus TaxID=6326 RepID=A0A1I7RT59_BURXY